MLTAHYLCLHFHSPTYIVHTSTQLSPIQYIRSFFRSRHLKNIVRLLIAPDPATIIVFFCHDDIMNNDIIKTTQSGHDHVRMIMR